ncbi:MAG: cytochrome c oxidase assembly protein, partial [Acidimicrobiales bacterium]
MALIGPAATLAVVGPWVAQVHPVALAVVVAQVASYVFLARGESRPSRIQRWAFAASMAALLVAESWPLEDLAAHWSLTALVLQRLLLILVVAPMLMLSIPPPLAARLTRPRAIDETVAFVSRPQVAVVAFTVIAVGT